MVAVTPDTQSASVDEPVTVPAETPRARHRGVVPTASMLIGCPIFHARCR